MPLRSDQADLFDKWFFKVWGAILLAANIIFVFPSIRRTIGVVQEHLEAALSGVQIPILQVPMSYATLFLAFAIWCFVLPLILSLVVIRVSIRISRSGRQHEQEGRSSE